jgi:hypothetical protein
VAWFEDGTMDASNDPVARLAKYWFRAKLMHDLMHGLTHIILEDNDRDLDAIHRHGDWWEFETFLTYWLSGLFVVVEGFNKLKLKDARVQRLFKEHIRYLKAIRHETYHFVVALDADAGAVLKQMNWAEELHEAIGEHIREYISKKALEELNEQSVRKRPRKKKAP